MLALISFCTPFAARRETITNTLQSGCFFNCGMLIQCKDFPFAPVISASGFRITSLTCAWLWIHKNIPFFKAAEIKSLAQMWLQCWRCSAPPIWSLPSALIQTTCGGWLAHVEATSIIFYRSYTFNFSPQTPIIFLTTYHLALMQQDFWKGCTGLWHETAAAQAESPSFAVQNFPAEIIPLLMLTLQWHFTWLHNLLPVLASSSHPLSQSAPLWWYNSGGAALGPGQVDLALSAWQRCWLRCLVPSDSSLTTNGNKEKNPASACM